VVLLGTAGETVKLREAEEIPSFGLSPDGQVFIIASSPSLTIFRRTVSDYIYTAGNASPTRHRSVASFDQRYRSWVLGSSHPARIGACPGIEKSTSQCSGP
jgi:hypothetical protein